MMELTCVLVLLTVGLATSSPHGYGTKGGATAKADAHAVAGTYGSAGSIPSGTGYAGSFSQSSSSSSSSASASSSSSSFSYSGSGTISGAIPGANGCGSGNCNGRGPTGIQDAQVYNGAHTGALAGGYGATIPTGAYGHKYGSGESQTDKTEDCGTQGCQGTNDSGSFTGNNPGIGSQSASDAKAAASAGAGLLASSDCNGSDCNRLPDTSKKCVSGQCDSNAKCSTGDCGAVLHTKDFSLQNGDSGNKCTSGQCDPNQESEENSSNDYETNDIHVSTSMPTNRKSNHGATSCSSGNCGSYSAPGSHSTPHYNKPARELTAPKQEPTCSGPNCPNLPSGYSSRGTFGNSCSGGNCGYSTSSQTKVPYTSHYQNVNQISRKPSSYGGFPETPTVSSNSEVYSPGVVPQSGTPSIEASAQQDSKKDLPSYTGGFGGPAGVLEPNNFSGPTPNHVDKLITDKPVFSSPGGLLNPSYSHGSSSYSPIKPSGPVCAPGTPGCGITASLNGASNCAPGNCGTRPAAPGYDVPSNEKSTDTPGNLLLKYPGNPSESACAPGSPDCTASLSASSPSGCASGNCGTSSSALGYNIPSNVKPTYSSGKFPSQYPGNPSELACVPGTSGCAGSPPPTSSSPTSGAPTIKPSYFQNSSNSKPACEMGTPGCDTSPFATGCTSGNCAYPSAPGNGIIFNIKPNHFSANPSNPACTPGTPGCVKPSYSHGSLPSNFPVNPSNPACTPGTPGCVKPSYSYGGSPSNFPVNPSSPTCNPDTPGCINPSYSHGNTPSSFPVNPSGPACIPGTPGCVKPSYSHANSPSNFPVNPSSPACTPYTPGCVKPSYSHESSPSNFPVNLSSPACTPGTPGCIKPSYSHGNSPSNFPVNPSSPACTSGTPGCVKPSYSHESSPSNFPVNPSSPACTPGTPGCIKSSYSHGSSPSNFPVNPSSPACTSGTPGCVKPSYSHESSPSNFPVNPSSPACTPGTPGCIKPSYSHGSSPSNFPVNPSSPACTPGTPGCAKPSYSYDTSPSYTQLKPSKVACAPGTAGCSILSSVSGPSGCSSGNCGSYPSLPVYSQLQPTGSACAPGTPGCVITSSHSDQHGCASGICNKLPPQTGQTNYAPDSSPSHSPIKPLEPECALGTTGCGTLPSGSSSLPHLGGQLSGMPVPNYSASGAGSSFYHGSYGSHGTGSIQTSSNKPPVGFSTGSNGSGAFDVGSPSYTGNVGATAEASTQQGTKKNFPAYTGGFGGPAGVLKPNEFSASTASFGYKPAISNNQLTVKPCSSGVCNAQATPIHSHSGSISATGAQATAESSANANAFAYTGGFGGPPGLLNPYDNGKIDHKGQRKQLQDSTVGLHREPTASGNHSPYSNSGFRVGGNDLNQSNAISATGVSGDNSHAHSGTGGCDGGCGGSSGVNLGYSGASSNGQTTAGAIAKSVASASSGARAYGGSYSSSSATAHADASIKGGYGRR